MGMNIVNGGNMDAEGGANDD
jgi:hypothetical protein